MQGAIDLISDKERNEKIGNLLKFAENLKNSGAN